MIPFVGRGISAARRDGERAAGREGARRLRRLRSRRLLGALAALSALATLCAQPAGARVSLLYEHPDALVVLTAPPLGLGPLDGAVQVQPGRALLPAASQAWKVSSRPPTAGTPSVLGRDGASLADLLAERVRRSGAHIVVLDELTRVFQGPVGAALAEAMRRLAAQPSPWGGESLARRVQVFVPNPRALMVDPVGWADAWSAITAAGGVWLEAYTPTPWRAEHWLAWPGPFAERFRAAGGDPARLHLTLTAGDQATQWAWPRTGAACALLANGPGAYRVGAGSTAFLAEFRATFGSTPAGDGPAAIACSPDPVLPLERVAPLADVLALGTSGAPLDAAALSPPAIVAGGPTRVSIALGADPLGLAARLGVDPVAFWRRARARVTAAAPGLAAAARLGAIGRARLTLTPTAAGPIGLGLVLDGAALREALGAPVNLLASLPAGDARLDAIRAGILAGPLTWTLTIPLVSGLRATAPAPPPAPVPAARPVRVALGLAGPRALGRARLDGRRQRLVVGRVLAAGGRPVVGARVAVRLPDGRGRVLRTGRGGIFRVVAPARQGLLRVRAGGGRVRADIRVDPIGA